MSEQTQLQLLVPSSSPSSPCSPPSHNPQDEDPQGHDLLPAFKSYPQIKPKFPPQLNPRDLIVTKKSQDETLPPIISRVPNAFIIYRKQFVKSAREQGYFLPMTVISSMASASWENEDEEVKLEYKRIAKEVLKCKKEMYPKVSNRKRKDKWNIVHYRPRSLKNGGRRTSVKKEEIRDQNTDMSFGDDATKANGVSDCCDTIGNDVNWSVYLTPALSESTSSLSSRSSVSSPTFGLTPQDHKISDLLSEIFNNSDIHKNDDITSSTGLLNFDHLTPTSTHSSPVLSNELIAKNHEDCTESNFYGSDTCEVKRSNDETNKQNQIDLTNFEFADDSERQKFEELYNTHYQLLSNFVPNFEIPNEFLNLIPDGSITGSNNEFFDSSYNDFNNMNNEFYNLNDSFNNTYGNECTEENGIFNNCPNFDLSNSLGIYKHNGV
ncbi:10226_t:CDS:1 [Acaulospora morrowiae]|uniref:10226_t:CDS:1 n=1 Tax=Acaulospora morrowiae TaxID=94023 RepID=A0A9N9FTK4_9GLOM|nr:10226_t:CDS:1 [Acaulospora morrowiae]